MGKAQTNTNHQDQVATELSNLRLDDTIVERYVDESNNVRYIRKQLTQHVDAPTRQAKEAEVAKIIDEYDAKKVDMLATVPTNNTEGDLEQRWKLLNDA